MSASASPKRALRLSITLFALTFLSTTYVGVFLSGKAPEALADLTRGLAYSVPLMSILLAHVLGHYFAARLHAVPATPPFFVPMPVPPLGTMGAVILMGERIERRNALLDIGAAGPLAGLAVALPVLCYGIAESPVQAQSPSGGYLMEGRSLLYSALVYAFKGSIAEGYDIHLSPTAFAGWAGLLITMINLIPVAQLDGGHVAYALLGERQEKVSRQLRAVLPVVALAVSLFYGLDAYRAGYRGYALVPGFMPGLNWLVWWLLLRFMTRSGPPEHPPTDDHVLSPGRRAVAVGTLLLFIVLFMPAWLREVPVREDAEAPQVEAR